MKEVVLNRLLSLIKNHKNVSDSDLRISRYGLDAIYNLFTKTTVVIIITLLINTAKEFGLLLVFYGMLRTFGYGIHADSSIKCWISTLTIYICGSILIKYLTIPIYISIMIWLFAAITFFLWAPADTPKRPLIRPIKRAKLKYRICLVSTCYLIAILFVSNPMITNALTLALLIEGISVNPITYFLTNTQFNNYKYYKKGLN